MYISLKWIFVSANSRTILARTRVIAKRLHQFFQRSPLSVAVFLAMTPITRSEMGSRAIPTELYSHNRIRCAAPQCFLRQDRGRHARVTRRGRKRERERANFHVLTWGVIASRVKCNASRSLLPHSVISRGTFLAASLTYYLSNRHATANFFAEVWPWRG